MYFFYFLHNELFPSTKYIYIYIHMYMYLGLMKTFWPPASGPRPKWAQARHPAHALSQLRPLWWQWRSARESHCLRWSPQIFSLCQLWTDTTAFTVRGSALIQSLSFFVLLPWDCTGIWKYYVSLFCWFLCTCFSLDVKFSCCLFCLRNVLLHYT